MGFCLFGAFYVVLQGNFLGELTVLSVNQGDLLILIATVMYGLYTALLPKSPTINPFSFLVCMAALGSATMLPFYLWEVFTIGHFEVTAKALMAVVFVAVFPSGIAYACWNKGASVIGPTNTGVFICLIPVFAALLAVPFLQEPFMFYHLVGMSLIFGGMILFNRNKNINNN
jgi:drug/metabolite transporter (DMT)-like permease